MAAGLGFKDFVTGEVLTAADVDGYLMQNIWVFASAAARDAAVTSPQEGNFAYLKDTNVTTYYTGSAWANLDTTGMTNPMTTTGDTIYSSSGSTPARLGIGSTGQVLTVAAGIPSWATPSAGGSTFVGCQITNSNESVSIDNATDTKVAMNVESIDTDGFHDNSTNNTRITIPAGKAGYYKITGSTFFSGNGSGQRQAMIYKNNAEVKRAFTPAYASNHGVYVSAVVNLAVGDYVEFVIRQTSGGALNCQWDSGLYGWFEAIYEGA
jgi:hypothetical protein